MAAGLTEVTNHGSIYLIRPLTPEATEWLQTHTDPEAQWLGQSLAVEPRYVDDIIAGMEADLL